MAKLSVCGLDQGCGDSGALILRRYSACAEEIRLDPERGPVQGEWRGDGMSERCGGGMNEKDRVQVLISAKGSCRVALKGAARCSISNF